MLTDSNFAVNVGEDCPVFEGLFEFCSISAGGTVGKKGNLALLNAVGPDLTVFVTCRCC